MARPRKNRTGDYARLLADELSHQLHEEVARALAASQRSHQDELAALRAEIRRLTRRVEALATRDRAPRARLGRWVPGGPGRPPKDAAARIAAFEARLAQPPAKPTRTSKPSRRR